MYSYNDSNIDTIITENIYQDVKSIVQSDINTLKIEDYFSDEIINNFDFSYVGQPNLGTVSESIDKTNKCITWDIDKLNGNEIATLKYKLKIKDMNNTALLNKNLVTNEKVVLTYNDYENTPHSAILTSSPIIQLIENKENNINNNDNNKPKDTTVANKELSNTGTNYIIISVAGLLVITSLIFIIKYKKIKDLTK